MTSTRTKVGRNDPCPCGSGRKYKKCCLSANRAETPVDVSPELQEEALPRFVRSPAPLLVEHPPRKAVRPSQAKMPARPGFSFQRVADDLNARLPGMALAPYAVARILETPVGCSKTPGLVKQIEDEASATHSIRSVAAMKISLLERGLASFGVDPSQDAFVRLAGDGTSAWAVSRAWIEQGARVETAADDDFLGLAACRLWARHLPKRPSVEMLDDQMQEGYVALHEGRVDRALEQWWQVWTTLRSRLTPEMDRIDGEPIRTAFPLTQVLGNWVYDFGDELMNASLDSAKLARRARQFFSDLIAQFVSDPDHEQVSRGAELARFHFQLGEPDLAGEVLHGLVERYPKQPWGYIALADAYANLFPGEALPRDMLQARSLLLRALEIEDLDPRDRAAVHERLADFSAGT